MDMQDVLRYLGVKKSDPELEKNIEECKAIFRTLSPVYTYAVFDAEERENGVFLQGAEIELPGVLVKKQFRSCKKILVVLATLGLKSEVLLKRIFSLSPKKGVILDAVYTDGIEKFLDECEKNLQAQFGELTERISCGYGDLPIKKQKELFDAIDGERLGVKMNDCFMLTPNKSVIALMGVR